LEKTAVLVSNAWKSLAARAGLRYQNARFGVSQKERP